jgi:FKBP-type peptidyl-prolyl cis-trans isomerase
MIRFPSLRAPRFRAQTSRVAVALALVFPAGLYAFAAAAQSASESASTPALTDEKARLGYAIGIDIGRGLGPLAADIDMAMLKRAIDDVLAGRTLLLDEQQAGEVRMAYSQRIQERQMAELREANARNVAAGRDFLAKNGKKRGVVTTASGLQYQVLVQGKGPKPALESKVRVHYTGTLLDGTKFDSSIDRGQPAEFELTRVIPGWTEALQLMPAGSKYRLWLPSTLGYGEPGTPGGPIPPGATLVFEVELLEVL